MQGFGREIGGIMRGDFFFFCHCCFFIRAWKEKAKEEVKSRTAGRANRGEEAAAWWAGKTTTRTQIKVEDSRGARDSSFNNGLKVRGGAERKKVNDLDNEDSSNSCGRRLWQQLFAGFSTPKAACLGFFKPKSVNRMDLNTWMETGFTEHNNELQWIDSAFVSASSILVQLDKKKSYVMTYWVHFLMHLFYYYLTVQIKNLKRTAHGPPTTSLAMTELDMGIDGWYVKCTPAPPPPPPCSLKQGIAVWNTAARLPIILHVSFQA